MKLSDVSDPQSLRNIMRADQSVPRTRRKAGDTSIDGRGRDLNAPAILSYGFRPFFFLGALYAALAVPFWVWAHRTGYELSGPFTGHEWHAHEMIFGFLSAVIAGFILTAVPNWTGRLPLSGWRLAVLVLLWVVGRASSAFVGNPWLALALDMAFPVVLTIAIWREVIAGKNIRNMPIAVLLTLFALANCLHHHEAMLMAGHDHHATGFVGHGLAVRLALGVTTMLLALIGGRIIPSFTRNWLVKQGSPRLPAPFGLLDKAALVASVVAVLGWIVAPEALPTGVLLMLAGVLLAVRMMRWQGWATWKEPIVLVLHVGYGWLAVGVCMLGASILWPTVIASDAALHTLTAGAVGTMTLAVMTRASLGHTGRVIASDPAITLIYATTCLGAFLRVLAPLVPSLYSELIMAGGTVWSLGFVLFVIRYAPVLWKPRLEK
jgi:uncharacterized protein involved in response to NO